MAKPSGKRYHASDRYYDDEDICSDNQKEDFKHYGEDSSQEPS